MKNFILFIILLFTFACQNSNRGRVETVENPPPEEIDFDEAKFDLQGHRGARGLLPENSIPAFIKAVDLGVRTIELDVVVNKENKLIVSHEPFMNHDICLDSRGDSIPTEKAKQHNIYQMGQEYLQQFDCGSIGNPRFPKQKAMKTFKPTLKQAIRAIEKHIKDNDLEPVFYNIETKSTVAGDSIFHPKPKKFAQLLYDEISDLKIKDRVFVQSFDVRTLQVMKKIDEEIPLVLLIENELSIEKNIELLGFTPSVYSPYFKLLTKESVRQAHNLGMKVIPWTVNEKSDMKKMISLRVDGLITDYPDRFISYQEEKKKKGEKD